jgi:hypothetical protein
MPLETEAIPHACEEPVVREVRVPTDVDAITFCGGAFRIVEPLAN